MPERPLDVTTMPLQGRHLIEASAGTGKTYTIGSLVLRALLGHAAGGMGGERRKLEEILIVTFTKAATEELRGRLQQRLSEALRGFATGHSEDPLLHALLEASEDHGRDRSRLQEAYHALDTAAVFTIHGFAQRVLARFALESGSAFDAELEPSPKPVLQETVLDFWRHALLPLPEPAQACLLERWPTPANLVGTVDDLLRRHDLQFDNRPECSLQGLGEALVELANSGSDRVDAVQEATDQATLLTAAQRELDALTTMLRGRRLDWKLLEQVARWNARGSIYGARDPRRLPADWAGFRFAAEATALRDGLQARLLADAVEFVRHRLDERKRQLRRFRFDDLLQDLDHALQGPAGERLAAELRRRYPLAMIDEFQDTDSLQWRSFSRIYATPEVGLLMIGDPKQAIYKFRGADIGAYVLARRATDSRFVMERNYRSTQALVEAVNRLFTLRADRDPFLAPDIPYYPVTASGGADAAPLCRDGATFGGLKALVAPQALSKSEARRDLPRACARHLTRLLADAQAGRVTLAGDALRPGHIAVLLRNRFEAESMRRELEALGVASVLRSRDSVFATAAAQDLYRLLLALHHPGDEQRLMNALAGGVLQRSLAELAALHDSDALRFEMQQKLIDAAERLPREGVLAVVRRLLHELEVPPRLLALRDGERQLTDLLHALEFLQQRQQQLDSVDGLIEELRLQLEAPDGELDEQQLRLESDADRVQLVTLHGSKGLEYPVVYLPTICDLRREDSPLYTDPDSLAPRYDLLRTPEALRRADRDRLAEDLRLLYVGLTRARQLCVLALADIGDRGTQSDLGATAIGHLLDLEFAYGLAPQLPQAIDTPACHRLFERIAWPDTTAPLAPEHRAAGGLRAGEARRRVERCWQVSSYSTMLRYSTAVQDGDFRQPELRAERAGAPAPDRRDRFGFPRGARAGSLLHELLETLVQSAGRASAGPLIDAALAREGYDPAWGRVLEDWLADLLDAPLDEHGLALSRLEPLRCRAELGFDLAAGPVSADALNAVLARWPRLDSTGAALRFPGWEGLLTGFIDLVFEHDGRYFVLDYKSNHLGDVIEDYDRATMHRAMAEHRYDLQYLLYLVALQRLLRERLGARFDYRRHVGGAYYLFLRGIDAAHSPRFGVFHDRPPAPLIDALDAALATPERSA